MSIKTVFTKDDFAAILAQYDLGSLTQAEPIPQGTVQTNYFLQTTAGNFVFRYYENRSRESVLFECDLLDHLVYHQYPCPTQIKNKRGAHIGDYDNKPYAIFGWVVGQSIEKPSARQWQQLIQKAAELQLITGNFRSRYSSFRMNYDPDLCRKLAHEEALRINSADARRKFTWLERAVDTLDLPTSLPKGICHGDFHFSNVLFQGDKLVALLDFDDANCTYLMFDLVGLIEYWAWPHLAPMLDLAGAHSVVREYQRHRPLSAFEQQHLFDVYRLSILFDCVWYFERGTADDFNEKRKIDTLNRLGRHKFFDELFRG